MPRMLVSLFRISVLVLLAPPASAFGLLQPDSGPARAPADAGDQAPASTDDYAEVIWNGKTYRVPLDASRTGRVAVGDSELHLQFGTPQSDLAAGEPSGSGSAASRSPAAEPPPQDMPRSTLILIGVLGTMVVGLLGYFGIIGPMRRRRPLKEALRILHEDQRPQFSRAEELLDQSLLAGLRRRDIARARFALGYVRARMGRYEEAGTVLNDLEKSRQPVDQPTAYLLLWVQSRLANHDRVERIYNEYHKLLADVRDTRMIVSISYLALARLRWARRETGGAMHYFDEIRKLEVLADEIPSHIDNHEVVMGTVALFENNVDEAQKHFDAAVEAARKHDKPTYPGRLGLLLCQWKRHAVPNIDKELADVLKEMQPRDDTGDDSPVETSCPKCGKSYRVRGSYEGRKVKCRSCRERFVVQRREADEAEEDQQQAPIGRASDNLLNDEEILLRNVRLWHCVTLLMSWLRREAESGLKPDDLETFRKRLEAVRQIDPEMGDPYLLGGLIHYWFAESNEERKGALSEIEQAVAKDVHVPEVLQLLDRENKLAALAENSLVYFHQIARQYAEDPEVDPELRDRFLRRMMRFERFQTMGEISPAGQGEKTAPSIENLQNRGQILRTRLSNIVRYKLTDAETEVREEIDSGLSELETRGQMLEDNTKAFQEAEMGLLQSTGEFLFQDEEPTGDDSSDHVDSNGDESDGGKD